MDGSILANFPKWLSIPIIILGLLITAWPKFFHILKETSLWNRSYELEKKRLELLKLRYEIEAIKKTSELSEITDVPYEPDRVAAATTPAPVSPMLFRQRFFYGALGAILPILITFLLADLRGTFSYFTYIVLLGYIIRLIFLISLSGLVSAVAVKRQATPITCFLVGLSVTLFINLLLTSTTLRPVFDQPSLDK